MGIAPDEVLIMSPRAHTSIGLLVALLGGQAAPALPPLEQLEARLELSPASQLAERAYESARDTFGAGQTGLGLSAYGSVGYANNHDVIDQTHTRTYNQGAGSAGLLLPLLGSRLQLQGALNDQQLQLVQLEAQRQLQRRELVRRLRKAYADYWQAQRAELLAQAYLENEPGFTRTVELRTRAGLLLESDRLEFVSGFALARRDAAISSASGDTALAIMRGLTGADLEAGVAVRPLVPSACVHDTDADSSSADADPELLGLQRIIALRESNPRDSALYAVQSNIQLSYQTKDEMTTGQRGGSAALSWWFQVPIEYGSQRRLLTRAAAAQLSHARLEYEIRRQELQEQRRELVARGAVLRQSAQFAAARVSAADAAVRERTVRSERLDSDVMEQLQRARMLRYNAAKAFVEADGALVYWYADWARFETATCAIRTADASVQHTVAHASAAQQAAPAAGHTVTNLGAQRLSRGLYVWRAAEWLTSAGTERGERQLTQLRSAGITRLLVSLDAEQLRGAMTHTAPLVHAVRLTHERGFKVELLLAEPSWILPARRSELLAIIGRLKAVPYDGLHLDLEPAQLDSAPEKAPQLLGSLAETLAAVSAASPWPVEVSIHPRDLDVRVGNTPFGQLLQRLRVEPTIMVYVANPERALQIAAPLLERYPELSFGVALSVERSLGPEESLWPYPSAERRRRIELVESQLTAANFAGITLQLEDGWADARSEVGD